jgi:hypothetical protein
MLTPVVAMFADGAHWVRRSSGADPWFAQGLSNRQSEVGAGCLAPAPTRICPARVARGVLQAMALPAPEIAATKYPPAATPAPQAGEPLPVAAEPGRGVAEGHELIDADPLALWTRDPIEKAHSIRLSNNADRSSGLAPTRPCQRIPARLEHAARRRSEARSMLCVLSQVDVAE